MKLLPEAHASLITQALQSAQAAGELPAFELPEIVVEPPKKPLCDYACSVALQLQKTTGLKPRQIAEIIVKHLPAADFVASVEIAGPGFINFWLSKDWLRQQVEVIIAEDERLFTLDMGAGKRAQVEFVSANPSGPITIGRSRGGIIGDTMARLLEAAGYEVAREYYFNNAGAQMVSLGNSLRLRYLVELGHDITLPDESDTSFYQGEYLIDFAKEMVAEAGDSLAEADWQPFKEFAERKMFEWIKDSLARVDIHHDIFFNENSLYESGAIWEVLQELETRGFVYRSAARDGGEDAEEAADEGRKPAVWFRSTTLGDDKDRVLVKSDGTPTYTLPDIAYHKNKIERGFDLLVNVLGADHGTQYRVVQYGIEALGLDPSKIHVIINQMVRAVRHDPQSGQLVEVKMSTRRGIYDTLDDLVAMTSADAVRYHLLARSPGSHLDFNLDEVVKQSNENPVYYIQNAYVRCAGIFREAAARGLSDEGADLSLLGEEELAFIRKALELGEVIAECATFMEPHRIAFYAQQLAGTFHPIYDKVRALHSEVPEDVARARLRFYRAAGIVLARVLRLMGMSTPERM